MGHCRICGVWIDERSSSAINDVCSQISCWKKAHPQLFEKGLPWDKELKVTTISHELHEQLREGLEKKSPWRRIRDLFTFRERK